MKVSELLMQLKGVDRDWIVSVVKRINSCPMHNNNQQQANQIGGMQQYGSQQAAQCLCYHELLVTAPPKPVQVNQKVIGKL